MSLLNIRLGITTIVIIIIKLFMEILCNALLIGSISKMPSRIPVMVGIVFLNIGKRAS